MPEHQTFVEGENAVIQCPAIFGATTEMFWQKGNNQVTVVGRFTPEKGQLKIESISMEDKDNYTCFLIDTQLTLAKTITVDVLPTSEFAPSINVSQGRIGVIYGESLNLPCVLEAPKENVTYSWTINTEFEQDNLINTRANLYRSPSEFLGGIYTCKVANEFGYDVVDFIVKIFGKFLIVGRICMENHQHTLSFPQHLLCQWYAHK